VNAIVIVGRLVFALGVGWSVGHFTWMLTGAAKGERQ
jgi:hypothetical protein